MIAEKLEQQLKRDPARVGRQIRLVVSLIVGLTFLIFGIQISRPRIYVLTGAAKTSGYITGYVKRSSSGWNAKHTRQLNVTAYHPTVEFQAGSQLVRFEDWRSLQRLPPVNSAVPVIYDPRDPAEAMIDESFWNFIPWAPITVIGFLALLYALRCWSIIQAEADGQRTTRG